MHWSHERNLPDASAQRAAASPLIHARPIARAFRNLALISPPDHPKPSPISPHQTNCPSALITTSTNHRRTHQNRAKTPTPPRHPQNCRPNHRQNSPLSAHNASSQKPRRTAKPTTTKSPKFQPHKILIWVEVRCRGRTGAEPGKEYPPLRFLANVLPVEPVQLCPFKQG